MYNNPQAALEAESFDPQELSNVIWALSELQPDRPPPRAWLERMLAHGAAAAAAAADEEAAEAAAGGGALRPRHVAMLLLALSRWRLAHTRKG